MSRVNPSASTLVRTRHRSSCIKIFCALAVVLIASTGVLFQITPIHASSLYAVHPSIAIIGNSGFTQQNGVTSGSGTRFDPYMIQGWSIAAPDGQAAISIQSTTAYFLIYHVQFLNNGLGLYNVTNGVIENSTLTSGSSIGIGSSTNVTIIGNTFSASGVYVGDPLSAPQTTGLTIANNTFSSAAVNVLSSESLPSHLNITGNTLVSTNTVNLKGISTDSMGATVVRNKITGGWLTVYGNNSMVSDNTVPGGEIQVSGSGTIVKNNTADSIQLSVAKGITLSDNALAGGVGFLTGNPQFDTPSFYDSHVMTGNTVNGKPLFYLARCIGASVDGGAAGEVIVASCSNVRVANLRLYEAAEGIVMAYVRNCTVAGNSFSAGIFFKGLDVFRSSNLQISRNNFNGTTVAISDSDNVTLASNVGVLRNRLATITISGGSGLSVSNNTLENSQDTALSIVDVTNARLTGNWISDSGNGLVVSGANGLNITANSFVRNDLGLTLNLGSLRGTFNTVIYHNNFVDSNGHQALYESPLGVSFDNGYPSGGNYWSDYQAVDSCRGPLQDICSGPDDIGDKPYNQIWEGIYRGGFAGNLTDRYPLVNPYGSFAWDTAAPTWSTGSMLTITPIDSTSLTLKWTGASDDAWVSAYRVYMDGILLANLTRVQNYTVAHLSPGSTHHFKVEAGDPGSNWSTGGPSATATLPQQFFTLPWWIEHWYFGILAGGLPALVASIVVIKRKKRRTQLERRV